MTASTRTRRSGLAPAVELADLVAAISATYGAAREAIQRRQFARLLRATSGGANAGLAVTVPGTREEIVVPSLELVPARWLDVAELVVEFDCVPLFVRVGRGRRVGLRVVRRGASRRARRVRIALSGQAGSHLEVSLDGRALGGPSSEPSAAAQDSPARRDEVVVGGWRRGARPVYLLAPADVDRIADLLGLD
ncbi:hypothetical protein OV090_10825 [Nannocystis sp. RBIL2]|uniref:hypothetical protein n=1 Tax=Nannocystis sp. RBIL2 TaxID=2996788 RepID=UPI00226DACAB|nr:hypothetical protein [Nannocystis sp. RBIL2]MCY1065257.1 hypothetical protein [Nannocystis sp. RBIL2]